MRNMTNSMIINNSISVQSDYISQGSRIYDSFINSLEKLKEMISSKLKKILSSEEDLELVLDIKESFESIEEILSKDPFYEEEYYAFFSIKIMSFYLLEDKSLYHFLDMILDLINGFIGLIRFKNGNSEEYLEKQEEFALFLSKYEQKFYTKICEPSEYYDEGTLSMITNSLLDL